MECRYLPPHDLPARPGPGPIACAYVQPSRRPTDGRYGENPNRLQHYYQFQVIIKAVPDSIQELYLGSLKELGMDPRIHDIRFVEDSWENPTLGAWGLGWEVWLNGMEVTRFTYFQQVGGLECKPVTGGSPTVSSAWPCTSRAWTASTTWCGPDGPWARPPTATSSTRNEVEQSTLQLRARRRWVPVPLLPSSTRKEAQSLLALEKPLPLPAERILRPRTPSTCWMPAKIHLGHRASALHIARFTLTKAVAEAYYASRGRWKPHVPALWRQRAQARVKERTWHNIHFW